MFKFLHQEIDQKQKIERFGCLSFLVLAAFYAFVCTPVNVLTYSNVLIADSVFPLIWDFVNDAVQYLYFWVSFSFLIYLAAKYGLNGCWRLLAVFAGCSVGRYFFSLLISLAFDKDWEVFGYEIKYVMLDVFGDLLMMGVVVLLTYLIVLRRGQGSSSLNSLQTVSVLQFSNPLLQCAISVAFIPALLRVASRILFDRFLGAPQGKGDLISMIIYYAGDVLCGVIGYLVIFLLVSQIYIKDEEIQQRD